MSPSTLGMPQPQCATRPLLALTRDFDDATLGILHLSLHFQRRGHEPCHISHQVLDLWLGFDCGSVFLLLLRHFVWRLRDTGRGTQDVGVDREMRCCTWRGHTRGDTWGCSWRSQQSWRWHTRCKTHTHTLQGPCMLVLNQHILVLWKASCFRSALAHKTYLGVS